jgi:hypothetical protein
MRGLERRAGYAALALLLILALEMAPNIARKSVTFDEPAHIGAGFSYLVKREFRLNLQHPPLVKEVAAVPLLLGGVHWPIPDRDWDDMGPLPDPLMQWTIGSQVLYENDHDRVVALARWPCLLLTLLLGGMLFLWGREILGTGAALAGLALFALDPNIVAHGYLVTTDAGFALFTVLFTWAAWRYLNHRTLKRLLLCALALGGALAAKFTALALAPIVLILLVVAARLLPAAVPVQPSTIIDPFAGAPAGPRVVWSFYLVPVLAAAAGLVVWAIYFFKSPLLYLAGLKLVNADHDAAYRPFMAGAFQPRFWTYYLIVYLLKEPLPAILLAFTGIVTLGRRDGGAPALDRAVLFVPPAFLFLMYTLFSDNLGMRYLIPVIPFLHLAGGAGARALWESGSALKRALLAVLFVWLGINAWGIAPDHLSFFNESACLATEPGKIGLDAGSACGTLWLDDSNVDWGQGVKQLAAWLETNAPHRRIGLAYFGTGRPQADGVEFDRVNPRDLEKPLRPGLYAISAHLLARARATLSGRYGDGKENWIAHTEPRAVVGHAFYVYDIKFGS